VLGLLDGGNFLGGDMPLNLAAATAAISRLGQMLGTGLMQTAGGIFRIVAETMAAAARTHATDRGVDYRGLPLLAFGGAGPVHACAVGELLQSTSVIFPPNASVLSAFGTLVTPVRLDLVRSALAAVDALDWGVADATLDALATEGLEALAAAGTPASAVRLSFGADLRYAGQQNEVGVELDGDPRQSHDAVAIRAAFERAYLAQYGVNPSHVPVELVSWRVTAKGQTPAFHGVSRPGLTFGAPKGHRPVGLWPAAGDIPVYDRATLGVGQTLTGPIIIEERETTIVVPPRWSASVDAIGCLIAQRTA
jgi:N-methylhydantoinase A